MGWSDSFHPGSDLNQVLGELLNDYGKYMPKYIYNILKPRIISHEKEFPYAITESNELTTGEAILALVKPMVIEILKV